MLSDDAPRRLHPVSPFFELIKMIRAFAVPILIGVVSGAGYERFLAAWILPLVVLLVRMALWRRYTYAITGGSLLVEQGILNRRRREVPLDRIQQVNLDRRLLHRMLGVVLVQVQTAGGTAGAEVSLDAVSEAEAARLREALLVAKSGVERVAGVAPGVDAPHDAEGPWPSPPPPPTRTPDVLLHRLSFADAALAGLTSSRLPVVLGFIGLVAQTADDLGRAGLMRSLVPDVADADVSARGAIVAGVLVLLGLGAVAFFVGGVASGVLKHHGFVLVDRGGELFTSSGLLTQREAVVPLARVQVVRIEEPPLQRLVGRRSILIQSAGVTGEANRMLIPIARPDDVDRIVAAVLPGDVDVPPLRPHPPAARRRLLVRRVVGSAPLAVALVAAAVVVSPWWALALVPLTAGVWWWARAAYRSLGHGYGSALLATRWGATTRRTWLVPAGKAQSLRVRTSPLQRRAGLADLLVDVAGGPSPVVRDAAEPDVEALVRVVLADRPRAAGVATSTASHAPQPSPVPARQEGWRW